MLKKITNLFNNTKAIRPVSPPLESLATNTFEDINDCVSWIEIEQTFTGVLLGCNSLVSGPMSKFEKSILASIHATYLKDTMPEYLVPRLPAVIPKIMQALRNEKTDVANLSNILSDDVVLVSEVIRLANSAYYSNTRAYESLEEAIIKIGFNGIRQMIISAAMKPILSKTSNHFVKTASGYLWDKTMNAGLISDCASKEMHEDRFHAYLSSLMLQTGMTVLIREIDKHYNNEDVPRNREFSGKLNNYALEVSARISEYWQFPDDVTRALREQILHDEPQQMSKLGSITFISDKLAKINILVKNHHLKTLNTDISKKIPASTVNYYSLCNKDLDIF